MIVSGGATVVRGWVRAWALAAAVLLSGAARADDPPAPRAPGVPSVSQAPSAPIPATQELPQKPAQGSVKGPVPAHAWVIVPKADRRESVMFHVPPRTGQAGARLSVAYIAERLMGVPARVAASGTRVYLVTDPEAVGGSRHRRVYTINARYEGAWGWSYQPEGRLGVLPSLPAEGELVSLAADPDGVSALMWSAGGGGAPASGGAQGTWSALRLEGLTAEAWTPLPLPWDAPPVGGAVEPPLRGCAALVVLEQRPTLVALRPRAGAGTTTIEGWVRETEAWQSTIGPEAAPLTWTPDGDALVGLDGRIVEILTSAEGVTVNAVWPQPRQALTFVSTQPDQPGAAVGFGVLDRGVIAVMWRGAADAPGKRGERGTEGPMGLPGASVLAARSDTARFKIAEVSIRTGRILTAGPVRQPTPLADRPLHVVALFTSALMGGLLIYTLRRGEPKPLPAPFRTGGLFRRTVATGTDLAIGLALAGVLWRSAPVELLTAQTLLGSVTDAAPIWAAIALAAAHSTLGELMLGGSIGKIAVGCRVAVVVPGAEGEPDQVRRATGSAVVIRNLIKWTLLPAVVLAAVDQLRRHAADVVANTVVIDLPDEPSAPAG